MKVIDVFHRFIAQYKAKWAEEFASPDCKIDLESKWQVSDAFNTAPTGKGAVIQSLELGMEFLTNYNSSQRTGGRIRQTHDGKTG